MPEPRLESLIAELRRFTADRNWQRFHTPKNLAMALGGEAGELLEQFQWLTDAEAASPDAEKRQAIEHEIADVLIYLVMLADRLDVDLLEAAFAKIELNKAKYPIEGSQRGPVKPDASS